jgi:hypothetical protein
MFCNDESNWFAHISNSVDGDRMAGESRPDGDEAVVSIDTQLISKLGSSNNSDDSIDVRSVCGVNLAKCSVCDG